jgi:hypothetical protein
MVKLRRKRWTDHVARTREMQNKSDDLEGKEPSKNLVLDVKRMEGVNWMHLAQDRDQWRAVVNTVMCLWVP